MLKSLTEVMRKGLRIRGQGELVLYKIEEKESCHTSQFQVVQHNRQSHGEGLKTLYRIVRDRGQIVNGIVVVLGQLGGEFQQGLFVLDLVSLEKGRRIYSLVL